MVNPYAHRIPFQQPQENFTLVVEAWKPYVPTYDPNSRRFPTTFDPLPDLTPHPPELVFAAALVADVAVAPPANSTVLSTTAPESCSTVATSSVAKKPATVDSSNPKQRGTKRRALPKEMKGHDGNSNSKTTSSKQKSESTANESTERDMSKQEIQAALGNQGRAESTKRNRMSALCVFNKFQISRSGSQPKFHKITLEYIQGDRLVELFIKFSGYLLTTDIKNANNSNKSLAPSS